MIVPEKQLVRANGLYQMLQYSIRVISPIAGAFFLEIFPMYGVLSIDIITAVIAIACIIPLGIPNPAPAATIIKANYYNDLKQGFQYIWSRRGLVMLIGLLAALVFFTAAPANLLPVLVNKHLGGDVVKLGWLGTAGGIGGIAGGLLLGAWGGLKKKIWTAILGFLIMIPCSVVVGFTSVDVFYATTIPALLFMGVGNAFVNAPLAAIINSVVAKDFQGRVLSLQTSIIIATMPLGLVIGGLVADAFDIRLLYWIAAAAWLVILPLATLSKPLMNLENEKEEETTAA